MPRIHRVFVDGRIYHVYNGFASGDDVLNDPEVALEFIDKGARHLEIDVADLVSRTRRRQVVEARRLLLTLGRERWGQKVKELGAALGKKADTISYLAREGIRQRLEE